MYNGRAMSAVHENLLIPCLNNLLSAVITRPEEKPNLKPSILILHGAGGSNKERSKYQAEYFASLGLATIRFDQSGQGESTGHIRNSSLAKKYIEAETVAMNFMQHPITVVGSSMGAQTAVMLTKSVPVANLVFIAPAAYGKNLWAVSFGAEFEFLIKVFAYWRSCPAWEILREFKGKILLVSAGREERVNPEVRRLYWDNAVKASSRCELRYADADHSVQLWFDKRRPYQTIFLNSIKELLQA